MIQIKLNGEGKSLNSEIKLLDFVTSQLNGKEPGGIAVALNEMIIPKQKWKSILVKNDDEVEIVHAVQGG